MHISSKQDISDPLVFEKIFREHFRPLAYYAARITGDVDSAREVVQSVFTSLWENRHSFDSDRPVRPYLYTAVHNRSLNTLRDSAKFTGSEADIESARGFTSEPGEAEIEASETESMINDAINRLPEKCRRVFMMSRFEDKRYSEIATELNISVKTVENQVSRALRILREELKDLLLLILALFSIFIT